MGLLHALFGGGQPQTPPGYTRDAQGNLVPINADPLAPAPAAPAPVTGLDPVVVTGHQPAAPAVEASPVGPAAMPDNWKPHHAGILGQIADYLLDTHFGKENERRNMESALQGMDKNPMGAINRVRQFDPDAAWTMYNQVVDNTRQKNLLDRQNRITDLMTDKYVNTMVGGMANAANEQNWPTMRQQIIKYGAQYGKDFNDLPDEYNPDIAQSLAEGVINPATQQKIAETKDFHGATTDYRNKSLGEKTRHNKAEEGLGAGRLDVSRGQLGVSEGRLGESIRHDGVTETQGQARIDQRPVPQQATSGQTSDGMPWVTTKDRTQLFLKHKDGKTYRYINVGGKGKTSWKLAGPVADPTAATTD